jgi:hypothetical protein
MLKMGLKIIGLVPTMRGLPKLTQSLCGSVEADFLTDQAAIS